MLEGWGLEIWMASVHYHDWSSDQGSLSLHSWNGKAHSHVASRCRNTTVFPQVHFLTSAAFLVNGLDRWSKTLRPQISRSQRPDFYLWGHTDLVYQQELEARDGVWHLRFPQWFCCWLSSRLGHNTVLLTKYSPRVWRNRVPSSSRIEGVHEDFLSCARHEFLMMVTTYAAIFWDAVICSLVEIYQCYGADYYQYSPQKWKEQGHLKYGKFLGSYVALHPTAQKSSTFHRTEKKLINKLPTRNCCLRAQFAA